MSVCCQCKIPTPGHLLIANDGLCNGCRDKCDKIIKEKRTLNAYEYLQIDKRISEQQKRFKEK